MIISSVGPNHNIINESFNHPFTLECCVTIDPYPLPQNIPLQDLNGSIYGLDMEPISEGSGVTVSSTAVRDGHTYSSSLNFSSLQESHTGLYTCRLGGNERLKASRMVPANTVENGMQGAIAYKSL